MKNIIKNFLQKNLFNNFFEIELTNTEKDTAYESLEDKYTKGLIQSLFYGLISIPTILFLDVSLLVSVLIPITMVSGTAWFAVSLVNIKKKFENFGNELTKDLYRSFCTSLVLLAEISVVSLNSTVLKPIVEMGIQNPILLMVSGITGTYVVLKMIYDVFSGATKYDMNDSMLTGQNESADRYYKKSLSILNGCANSLKSSTHNNINITAYYFSLAFYEIFNYLRSLKKDTKIKEIINNIETLKLNPPLEQEKLKNNTVNLIHEFIQMITNTEDKLIQKSLKNISNELEAILKNKKETIELFNLRLATILEEIENLMINYGEILFIKREEIERKFLINRMPNLKNAEKLEIEQGYIVVTTTEEERVRKINNEIFLHTIKKDHTSGYREEIEKNITKEEFETLWEKTKNKRIYKTRYVLKLDDNKHKVEIDIFKGTNEGLTIAEVEFKNEEDAISFKAPKWFGDEVTKNKEYKNQSLAR